MQKRISQREEKSQQKIRDTKGYLAIISASLFLSLAADIITRSKAFAGFSGMATQEVTRAWIYCAFAYVSIVPAAAYMTRKSLSGFRPKKGRLFDRIVYLVLGIAIFVPMFFSPFLFLTLASENVGRSHLVYIWLTGSTFGLAVAGGTLFYGAAVGIWLLSAAINNTFNK